MYAIMSKSKNGTVWYWNCDYGGWCGNPHNASLYYNAFVADCVARELRASVVPIHI